MKSFQCRFLTFVHSGIKLLMLIIIAYFFSSCKEKEDEESPRVIIEKPFENQTFSTIDTINVIVRVTDNEQIKSIKISLVDNEFNGLGIESSYSASGSIASLDTDFLLEEPFLNSDSYYLAVRASDGENEGSGYVHLQLSAIERIVQNLFVVTASSNQTRVYTGEGMNSWDLRTTLAIDFAGAALNYKQDLLGIAGGVIGDAVFYETQDFTASQTVPGFGTPSLPYFLSLQYDVNEERFLLSQRNEQLRILDKLGVPNSMAQLTPNFLPVMAFPVDNDVFVDQKSITGNSHILSRYASSGFLLNSFSTSGVVKEVSKRSQDETFIWVNGEAGAKMSILNNTSNLIADVYNREGEVLYAAKEIGSGVFVISTSAGLLRYSYPSGGTLILNAAFTPKNLYYDDLNGFIYGTQGNTLYKFTSNGVVIDTYTFGDSIAYFAVDYNR